MYGDIHREIQVIHHDFHTAFLQLNIQGRANGIQLPSIETAKCGLDSLGRHVESGGERLVNQHQGTEVLADCSI